MTTAQNSPAAATRDLHAIIDSVKADARPSDSRSVLEARVIEEFVWCASFGALSDSEVDAVLAAAFGA